MSFQETFNTRVMPAAERAFGVLVALAIGEDITPEFTAMWHDQQYEVEDEEGFRTAVHSRDFTFAKTDCTVRDVVTKPRTGCRIKLTENGVEKAFEVVPIGNRKSVEEEPGGYRWRVHTNQVA